MTAPEFYCTDCETMMPVDISGRGACGHGRMIRADLAAVPAQVMVKPWNYCPECGCEEIRYGEGPHKQCSRCHQEWFTDIDYSGVVRGNLERLFIAAIEPHPDPRDDVIARLVEAVDALEMWDASRGYPVPYRIRDPLRAALAAAKVVQP